MGWKNIRDHYRIEHIVQVTEQGIEIGSGYIHDIIVIDKSGSIIKRYENQGPNEDLVRYQKEMDASPEVLRNLLAKPDEFAVRIPVYSYNGSDIVEDFCEEPGYPNITHDGVLMHENTHSPDKNQVIEWALRGAKASIHHMENRIQETEESLARSREKLEQFHKSLARLEELSGEHKAADQAAKSTSPD